MSIVASLVVVLAVAACADDSGTSGSSSGGTGSEWSPYPGPSVSWPNTPEPQTPSTMPATQSFVLTANSRCPAQWFGFLISTTAPEAKPFLSEVAACGSGSANAIWLRNEGAHAWRLTLDQAPAGGVQRIGSRQSQQAVFATALPGPADTWLLPGDAVQMEVSPRFVHWSLDTGQSSSWSTFLGLAELAANAGDPLVDEFKRRTPRGNALVTCASSVVSSYDVYAKRSQQPSYSLVDAVSDGLDVTTNGRNCASAWNEAERYHQTSVPANRLPTVLTEEPRLVQTLERLEPWVQAGLEAVARRG